MNAAINAAKNIALLGVAIKQPEKSGMCSCVLHNTYLGFKSISI